MKIIFKKSFDKSKKKLSLSVRKQLTKRLLLFEEEYEFVEFVNIGTYSQLH